MLVRLLIVDGDIDRARRELTELRALGYAVTAVHGFDEAVAALARTEPDAIAVSAPLPDGGALALCARAALVPGRPHVVLVAEAPSFAMAVGALRAGVFDLVLRDDGIAALHAALRRALREGAPRTEHGSLQQALAGFDELIGVSQPMLRMYAILERASETAASVLVTGESGTGKELVARALHRRGRRVDGPFVAVNCSALPEPLLESELFGHVKGAFTDAKAARAGLFVKASGGTLFLDELGEMPLPLQPKLLRALQERKVRPVGGDEEVPFDVRVIAATNRNLEAAAAARSFREDLFYRINVIHVDVPPLRERAADVLLLAQHFVQHFAAQLDKPVLGLSHTAGDRLMAYDWPGNVRELQNCIERAVALTTARELGADDLPEKVRSSRRSHMLVVSNDPSELVSMDEVERRYVLRVLQAVGGNKKEAARVLGFDRKTLYRKLERYGVSADKETR